MARTATASLKVPKRGDFRVQEEHGSTVVPIAPEPALLAAGDAAVAAVGSRLLYARVDLVRSGDSFRVMELELVEPGFYLRTDPGPRTALPTRSSPSRRRNIPGRAPQIDGAAPSFIASGSLKIPSARRMKISRAAPTTATTHRATPPVAATPMRPANQ